MMTEKKIIAVVGATGAQGGGLVRAILADHAGLFTARALTRNADSDRARELASQGAEVIEADLDDEPSLRKAFDGAYGAYVVTNFWAQRTPEQEQARTRAQMELDQAAAAARAAKDAELRHVVWSTLEDTRPHFWRLGINVPNALGNYKVPHFDAEGEANASSPPSGCRPLSCRPPCTTRPSYKGKARTAAATASWSFPSRWPIRRWRSSRGRTSARPALGVFRRGAEFIGKTVSIAAPTRQERSSPRRSPRRWASSLSTGR
jgi:nucleoside-diphosphate-sugar epimerase